LISAYVVSDDMLFDIYYLFMMMLFLSVMFLDYVFCLALSSTYISLSLSL